MKAMLCTLNEVINDYVYWRVSMTLSILREYYINTDNFITTFVKVVNWITIELHGIQSIGVIKKLYSIKL